MRKTTDFPPYEAAEIKKINDNGSVLCDLYGEEVSFTGTKGDDTGTGNSAAWLYQDTDICFPAGSQILSLTEEEIQEFEKERKEEREFELQVKQTRR